MKCDVCGQETEPARNDECSECAAYFPPEWVYYGPMIAGFLVGILLVFAEHGSLVGPSGSWIWVAAALNGAVSMGYLVSIPLLEIEESVKSLRRIHRLF